MVAVRVRHPMCDVVVVTVLVASPFVALRGWLLVGGYALPPPWADGHARGLYSFTDLRKLGG